MTVDVSDMDIRRRVVDLPVLEEFPGMCYGWLGQATPLYAGHDPNSAVIGEITPGTNVRFYHVAVGEWTYVTVDQPGSGSFISGGWYDFNGKESPCREFIP